MNDSIVVILLTYQRTEYAVRTIQAARRHLKYHDILWYVADDGSNDEHMDAVLDALHGATVIGWHSDKLSYGGGANRAWQAAHQYTPLTFWLEDDWELQSELDLTPYAHLLDEQRDVGMVRLGYLNINMRGTVFGFGGHLYWRLERDADSYVFTGHPSLRHWRYRENYGYYPEGLLPGETELAYAYQYRQAIAGPDIVWPARMAEYGLFGHIGEQQSY